MDEKEKWDVLRIESEDEEAKIDYERYNFNKS
jgi:hypothetical protein